MDGDTGDGNLDRWRVPCRPASGLRKHASWCRKVERGWCRGLRYQEAPQENGQEEAPQAAAEDARSAAEQEVARAPGQPGTK